MPTPGTVSLSRLFTQAARLRNPWGPEGLCSLGISIPTTRIWRNPALAAGHGFRYLGLIYGRNSLPDPCFAPERLCHRLSPLAHGR